MMIFKKIAMFGAFLVFMAIFAAPAFAGAQVSSSDPKNQDTGSIPDKTSFQLVSCDGVQKYLRDEQGRIIPDANGKPTVDPRSVECDFDQLILTIQRIINFALWLVSPIVVCMLVYTGFKYVTAGGDVNLIADAKRMFTPILIGIFFIMAGWLLVYTVLDKLLGENVGGLKKTDILPPR
ncbi:MAG TPA: pilin [Candidatus Paceibacterota bacterium]